MVSPTRVFLSPSFADGKLVAKLLAALRRHGLEAEAPQPTGKRGAPAARDVAAAIRASNLILVLVSSERPDDMQQAIWPEVLSASWKDPSKLVVPVLVKGASTPPFVLSCSRAFAPIHLADPADADQIEDAAATAASLAADKAGSRASRRSLREDDPAQPSYSPMQPATQRGDRMIEIERYIENLEPPSRPRHRSKD